MNVTSFNLTNGTLNNEDTINLVNAKKAGPVYIKKEEGSKLIQVITSKGAEGIPKDFTELTDDAIYKLAPRASERDPSVEIALNSLGMKDQKISIKERQEALFGPKKTQTTDRVATVAVRPAQNPEQYKETIAKAEKEFAANMVRVLSDPSGKDAQMYFERPLANPGVKQQIVPDAVVEKFKNEGKLELMKNLLGCDEKGFATPAAARVFDQISATGINIQPWSQNLVPNDTTVDKAAEKKDQLPQRINEKEYRAQWEGYIKACPEMAPYVDMDNKEKVFYPGDDAVKYFKENKAAIQGFATGKSADGEKYYEYMSKFESKEMNVPKIRTEGENSLPALKRHNIPIVGSPVQSTVDTPLLSQTPDGDIKIVMVKRSISQGFKTEAEQKKAEEDLKKKDPAKTLSPLDKSRLAMKNVPVTVGGMNSLNADGTLKNNGLSQGLQEMKEEAMNAHIIVPDKDINEAKEACEKAGCNADQMKLINELIKEEKVESNTKLGQSLTWQGAKAGTNVMTLRNPSDLEGKIPEAALEKLNSLYKKNHDAMVANLPREVKAAQELVFKGTWDPVLTAAGSPPNEFFNFGDDRLNDHRVTRGQIYYKVIPNSVMSKGVQPLLSAGSDAMGAYVTSLKELKEGFDKGEKWSAHDQYIALTLIDGIAKGQIKPSKVVTDYLTSMHYSVPTTPEE